MTSFRTLHDGTPIPDHLHIAHQEAAALVYEASRVSVALRDLSSALSDEDDPLPEAYRGGVCEAVALIGDYLEHYATQKREFLEYLAREHHSKRKPAARGAKAAKAEEVTP